jgi:proton-coupled amino acid transporter
MPDAIKNSGLLVGSIGLVILSVFCVTSMHMLVKSSSVLCERTKSHSLDYADVAEVAFATAGSQKLRKFAPAAR